MGGTPPERDRRPLHSAHTSPSLGGTRLHEGQRRCFVVIGSRDCEGRAAVVVCAVGVSTGVHQRLDGQKMVVLRGSKHRSSPQVGCKVHLRPSLRQRLDGLHTTIDGRSVQRSEPLSLSAWSTSA